MKNIIKTELTNNNRLHVTLENNTKMVFNLKYFIKKYNISEIGAVSHKENFIYLLVIDSYNHYLLIKVNYENIIKASFCPN